MRKRGDLSRPDRAPPEKPNKKWEWSRRIFFHPMILWRSNRRARFGGAFGDGIRLASYHAAL